MNICVCGWHYGDGIDTLKKHGGFVVSHKPHPKADVVIPNVGLEFGAYDWYLKNKWSGGDTFFTHDDNRFSDRALRGIAKVAREFDQAFIFSTKQEAYLNGYGHGRAFICSDRFLSKLKADGGFWYDEGQMDTPSSRSGAPDYHNNAVSMFRSYLSGCNSGMKVKVAAIVPECKLGNRGDMDSIRLNLGCGQMPVVGYTNVDIYPGKGVDLECDIRQLPYEPNTVTEIMLLHAIEHFTLDDAVAMLRSYYKMLIKGGRIVIEAPDVYKAVRNRPDNQLEAIVGIFGDMNELRKGKTAYQHLWGWTGELMKATMEKEGFRDVQVSDGTTHGRPWRDFRVTAVK